jgi:16S rRNA (cytosine967-C5)-methyltransferase
MRISNLPDGNKEPPDGAAPGARAASEARDDAVAERARREGADGRLGARVAAIWAEAAAADFARAPEAIARALRAGRDLASAERRFVADALHALLRHRRRLVEETGAEEPRALVAAWLAWPDGEPPGDERLARLADPTERLGRTLSYPDWIAARLVAAYGADDAFAIARAMNQRAPLTVRANRLRDGGREPLAERLRALGVDSRPTPLAPDGLVLHTRRNVYELPPHRDGAMELQDEGSQLVAEVVAPPPRGLVVDACAGAGGKTLALGAALGNRGRLVALDVAATKLVELRRRARRAGLTNVRACTVASDGSGAPVPPGSADRVLVDAPCSGLGVVRRNPETKWRLAPADLDELARKQRAILDAYAALVAPGGRLVYATCSLLPEENEATFASFLAAHPGFEPVPLKEVLGRERALTVGDGEVLRLVPHRHGTDGFFAAVARRRRG